MSYGIMAYLVDTQELQRLTGSRDQVLKNQIIQQNKSEVDDLDGFLYDLYEEEDITVANILGQFISGELPSQGAGAAYGYVFKLLCEHLGTFLPNSYWYPCAWDDLDLFGPAATYALPIRFPSPDDFPTIKYISREKIEAALAALEGQELGGQAREYRAWLEQARQNNRDIYLFYH